jgi:riboflavin kinase/FMN adenylyltransferase
MKVYDKITRRAPAQVLAIGTFDGLHRGHKFVIERAGEYAKNNNLPVSVLTFEPEPAIYFNNIPVYRRRLLTIPDKLRIIDSLNVDTLLMKKWHPRERKSLSVIF